MGIVTTTQTNRINLSRQSAHNPAGYWSVRVFLQICAAGGRNNTGSKEASSPPRCKKEVSFPRT